MDIIDRAQEHELNFTAQAIYAARIRRDDEDPLYLDGIQCCLDCKKPIPIRRLEVKPDAVRCVVCQDKRSKGMS